MQELHLDIKDMDKRHDEFLEILTKTQDASKQNFLGLYKELIEHTQEHFSFEEALMKQKSYYGLQEHKDEHNNLLSEMEFFYEKAEKMPAFGHSYIHDYALDKFTRHIMNIDSQLAMFLKEEV